MARSVQTTTAAIWRCCEDSSHNEKPLAKNSDPRVAASFQRADATRDTMKSCRHKRYRHLILNWFRTGGGDLIGRRRGIQRQGETDRKKSVRLENAARHRNRTVSPDEEPCPSRKYPADSAEEAFSEGSFSHRKKCTKTAKAEARFPPKARARRTVVPGQCHSRAACDQCSA